AAYADCLAPSGRSDRRAQRSGSLLTAKQAPAGPAPPRRSVCAPAAVSTDVSSHHLSLSTHRLGGGTESGEMKENHPRPFSLSDVTEKNDAPRLVRAIMGERETMAQAARGSKRHGNQSHEQGLAAAAPGGANAQRGRPDGRPTAGGVHRPAGRGRLRGAT